MHTENEVIMCAPFDRVFCIAADLSLWPRILPHYRYVKYFERSATRNVVRMAARRGWIPVRWTSEQVIDQVRREVRFCHLKSFTKGMHVVWTFTPADGGVRVRISHDLVVRVPLIGGFLADRIIGRFFVSHIAARTLANMKRYVESADA